MQDIIRETEPEVCMPVKTKKVYVYDRTRTKVCCFCGLTIRYDCLARHKQTKKCTIIKNLLKDQLLKVESGQKIIIPDIDTNERINKKKVKDPVKKMRHRKKKTIEP